MKDTTYYQLRLFLTKGIGNITYKLLVKKLGSEEKVLDFLESGQFRANIQLPTEEFIIKQIEISAQENIDIVTTSHRLYPSILFNCEDSPPVFFVKGNGKNLLNNNLCGFVGSRAPAIYSINFAKQIGQIITNQNINIISGLAEGIDTIGHEASLEIGTIAVMAGGIKKIYPESNEFLYNQILKNGCVVSTQLHNQQPASYLFPLRNRFLSCLASGLVVIEASKNSGSLITANFMKEHKKPIWVVPGHPLDPRFEGNLELIKNGASIITNDFNPWNIFNNELNEKTEKKEILPDLDFPFNIENTEKLLSLIGLQPVSLIEISNKMNLEPEKLLTMVIFLSLQDKLMIHENQYISSYIPGKNLVR